MTSKKANETVTIILPLPPRVLSPNCAIATVGGRFAKASATKKLRALTKKYIEEEKIETAPWKKVKVCVEFFYCNKQRRDQDNASASLKAVYDGIVDSGLVEDDDWKHMVHTFPTFHLDKNHPRVQLVVTRLE